MESEDGSTTISPSFDIKQAARYTNTSAQPEYTMVPTMVRLIR